MFINTRKIFVYANRLASKDAFYGYKYLKNKSDNPTLKQLHTTQPTKHYGAAVLLPIPNNIDSAETTRFSPQRARDISANVILSQTKAQTPISMIDITTDSSMTIGVNVSTNSNNVQIDPHVQSYDCFGAISLNSAMQSNVPTPFGGMHKFSHLNMPGGQWSQDNKFMSQNLHSSHYRSLRENARSSWIFYDQDATLQKAFTSRINRKDENVPIRRGYCTQVGKPEKQNEMHSNKVDSKKERLKQAFKDYGATVIVFHVAISLASLGGCYLLVSGGVNMMPVLEFFGLANSSLSEKLATGSTFVIAYAIHKVFAPVRISITLGTTPFIVRYLRSKGLMKPKIK